MDRNLEILIVDDNESIRMMLEYQIKILLKNATIYTASNDTEAKREYNTHSTTIQFIFMDEELGKNISGLKVAQEIFNSGYNGKMYGFTTKSVEQEYRENAIKVGYSGFIAKNNPTKMVDDIYEIFKKYPQVNSNLVTPLNTRPKVANY